MRLPSIATTLDDPRAGVRWRILAYRPLTRGEAVACVRQFLASRKRKRIKPGTEITIVTTLGIAD